MAASAPNDGWRWTSRGRALGRVLLVVGISAATAGAALSTPTAPGVQASAATVTTVVDVRALAASPDTEEALRARVVSRADRADRILALPVTPLSMSARFGERGAHWRYRHTGLDFNVDWGTPVHSPVSGVVIRRAFQRAYGNVVVIRRSDGVDIWFCHLSSFTVKRGQHVQSGAMIGRVGATGNATGAHLHMEVRVDDRPTDPYRFLFGPKPGVAGTVARWIPPGFMPLSIL